MFNDKYIDWNQKRIKGIIDFYGYKFFFLKKLLDLGCGHADISGALYRLGSEITVVDARQSHLQMVKKKFPNIKMVQADLDATWPFSGKQFDIILHMGLLCHLENYEEQLKRICASTTHLILETTVCDSDDPYKSIKINENKGQYDMSFNGIGCRPTAAAIERVLNACGMNFRRLDNAKFNSGSYVYDWYPQNRGECDFNKRRLWICVKSNHPIQFAKAPEPSPIDNVTNILQNSNVHIAHRPMVLTKSQSVPHEQKIVSINPSSIHSTLPVINGGKSTIRLFVNYYETTIVHRQEELSKSLISNIDNPLIEVIILNSDNNPTFDFFFEKINLLSNDNDINIIANSDVFFDNSIYNANQIQPGQVFGLSCWDVTGPNSFKMPIDSIGQNAWIVRGKVKDVKGDFQIGKPGSDSRIAYEFQKAGYTVSNPALSIKAFHLHNSSIRNYTEADRIQGDYLSLPIIGLKNA